MDTCCSGVLVLLLQCWAQSLSFEAPKGLLLHGSGYQHSLYCTYGLILYTAELASQFSACKNSAPP